MCAFQAHAEPASHERGRALLLQRQDTGCILCHQIPGLPVGGELGPSLQGLAQRSTPEQARERIADARRFNPQTIMPAYLSTEGLHNVAKPYRGQTVLTPAALDDIVSYLFQPNATAP
jgi:sulfur-oxidizing protein SoxX